MIDQLNIGDTVEVWPAPGHGRVPELAGVPGRLISAAGQTVVYSEWIHRLVQSGALLLTDPRKVFGRAKRERHPDEYIAAEKMTHRELLAAREARTAASAEPDRAPMSVRPDEMHAAILEPRAEAPVEPSTAQAPPPAPVQ
jgi:hypothetical protein